MHFEAANMRVHIVAAPVSFGEGGKGRHNSKKTYVKHAKMCYCCHFYAGIIKFGLISILEKKGEEKRIWGGYPIPFCDATFCYMDNNIFCSYFSQMS